MDNYNVIVFCKECLEKVVADRYDGSTFNADAIIDEVLNYYPFDVVSTTVACMVMCKSERDIRISRESRSYSKSKTYCVVRDSVDMASSDIHSGLLDLMCKSIIKLECMA